MSYHKITLRLMAAALSLMLIPSFGVLISSADVVSGDNDDDIQYLAWLNAQREDYEESEGSQLPTRSGGGALKWKVTLSEVEGHALSTPTLADLNMDGTLEVVIASEGDAVYALNPNGTRFWPEPYTGLQIDPMDEVPYTYYNNQTPPPFFASPAVKDICLGETPEILIGGVNATVCLGSDGSPIWISPTINGTYFASPTITDLEGNWTGNKEELEVILAADLNDETYSIEALSPNGSVIFRECYPHSYSIQGNIAGAVTAQDMDGDFWNSSYPVLPPENAERRTELLFGGMGDGLRFLEFNETDGHYELRYDGQQGGVQHCGSISVANITGSPDCEVFITASEGTGEDWTSWGGKFYMYLDNGMKAWDFFTGSAGASIFTSPAIADIQMAFLDPEEKYLDYEVVFGADNGIMYVMNTEFHSLLWSFDTGGRILSSPAICNIDIDDELEIVIGSNSGKVFCFDGDPTDGIDEGFPYPGDGTSQDVLWVYDTKTPIGISSPVIADIDLDGQLEVIIGDSEGTVWCISAGGRSTRGQKDWVTSCCNDNRTGQYGFTNWYGVDIYPKTGPYGRPDPLAKSIQPGGIITFNLTVENTGFGILAGFRDKIMVELDQESVREGWSAKLILPPDEGIFNPDYVMLASLQTAPVRLEITAPWEGRIGEMARVNITAVSTGDPKAWDKCTTLIILDLYVDFELSYLKQPSADPLDPLVGQKWDKVDPGTYSNYTLSVLNRGNLNDTYEISLLPPPIEAGWNWSFVETGTLNATVSLSAPLFNEFGGVSGATLTVQVHCPENASYGEPQSVTVEGTSLLSLESDIEDIVKTDTIVLNVTKVVDIFAYAENDSIELRPFEAGTLDIWIGNNGNARYLEVLVNVNNKASGFDVRYPSDPVGIFGSELTHVVISVKTREIEFDRDMIVEIEYCFDVKVELHIRVRVNASYYVNANLLTGQPIEIEHGRSGSAMVKIWNNGTEKEVIDLSYLGDDRISVYFMFEEFEVQNITLDPLTSCYINVKVFTERYACPGPVDLMVFLYIDEWHNLGVPVDIVILDSPLIHLGTYEDGETIEMDSGPGEENSFITYVQNNGNTPEVVSLWIGEKILEYGAHMSIPDSWVGGFTGISRSRNGEMSGLVTTDRMIHVSDLKEDGWFDLKAEINTSGVYTGYVDHLTILINPGDILWVEVTLIHDDNYALSRMVNDFQVWLYYNGELHPEVLDARVNMFYADLEVEDEFRMTARSGVEIEKAVAGESFKLVFYVTNIGNWVSPQTGIKMRIDGIFFGYLDLESMNPGDIVEISISLELDVGDHTIQIDVDPENKVVEIEDQFNTGGSNQSNNIAVFDLVASEPSDKGLDKVSMNVIAAVLMLLMAIVSLVAMQMILSRKKDRRGEPMDQDLKKNDILGDQGFKGREE